MLPDLGSIGLILIYIIAFITLFSGFYMVSIIFENTKNYSSPKPKKIYSASIIVPVHNGSKYITECIESLLKLNYPKDKLEIIVVDDGSTDDSFKKAKAISGIKVYRKKHEGKSAALNYGIRKARGELIGILDADSTVDKNALMKIIGFFEDPKVGAVHSGMRTKNRKNLLEKLQEVEYLLSLFLKKTYSLVDGLYITPGVFSIYRAKIFKEIGSFDTAEFSEDLEISMRIVSQGYILKCAADAITYTNVPSTFSDLKRQRVRWNSGLIKNMKRYSFLMSEKYGELGYYILPMMIIGHIGILVFFSYISIDAIFQLINTLYLISISGLTPFLSNILHPKFSFGFIQSTVFFYAALTTLLGLFFLQCSEKYCFYRKSSLALLPQYFVYLFVGGFAYFYFWIATFYTILRRDIKW